MITVKEATIYEPTLLMVTPTSDTTVTFSWASAEAYDPMLYFLAVEDARGANNAASDLLLRSGSSGLSVSQTSKWTARPNALRSGHDGHLYGCSAHQLERRSVEARPVPGNEQDTHDPGGRASIWLHELAGLNGAGPRCRWG
jgi:hypothetical protein